MLKKCVKLFLVLMGSIVLIYLAKVSIDNAGHKTNRPERFKFLVGELTISPERQQDALNEIVKDGDGAFVYLIKYLDDKRLLSESSVRFLNIHPGITGKYFMTKSSTVGELVLRYLCWKTISCDAWFDVNDAAAVAAERQKIVRYCKERYLDPATYEGNR